MENNKMKERVRKSVKEKIAISNIRKEFDMNKQRSKKSIYAILSACAIFVVCLGLVVSTRVLDKDYNTELPSKIAQKEEKEEKEMVEKKMLKINKIEDLAMAKIDADVKNIEIESLPEKYSFINNIVIPKDYKLINSYNIYTRNNKNTENYSILHDYVFSYGKDDVNSIRIACSEKYQPVRDYWISEGGKISKIGDADVVISQYKEMYIVTFTWKNINFDVETEGVKEEELVALLESIIKESSSYNISNSNEDKDNGVNEQVNENINYPEFYAGRYVDENGINVILMCRDNEEDRKQICNLLGITESKTKFKTAKYSYKYLEELQGKISEKMTNKTFDFITTSSIRDDKNNILIIVTTESEEKLNKLKELDTIGGALDIVYSKTNEAKEDLLVRK